MLKRVLEMFISNKIITFQVEMVKRINYSVHHRQTKYLFCCVPGFEYKSCMVGLLKKPLFDCPIRLKGNLKYSCFNFFESIGGPEQRSWRCFADLTTYIYSLVTMQDKRMNVHVFSQVALLELLPTCLN